MLLCTRQESIVLVSYVIDVSSARERLPSSMMRVVLVRNMVSIPSLENTRGDMRGCLVTLQQGHRAVPLPCGNRCHALHGRCLMEALAKGAASAPIRYPLAGCGVRHKWRGVLEVVAQAHPDLCSRVVRMGGRFTGGAGVLGWQ